MGEPIGTRRERDQRRMLEADGWWVARAAGSLGDADLVALRGVTVTKDHVGLVLCQAVLIESKATAAGPYNDFLPKDRAELSEAARIAGAEAWLCWWPAHGGLAYIPEEEWPAERIAA